MSITYIKNDDYKWNFFMKFQIKKPLTILCIVFNYSLCQVRFHLLSNTICTTSIWLVVVIVFDFGFFPCWLLIYSSCLIYWHVIYENEMVKWKWKKQWTTTNVTKHQYLCIHVKYHHDDVILNKTHLYWWNLNIWRNPCFWICAKGIS